MIRKMFLERLNKYASKWLVLTVDISLILVSFIISYFIKFNTSFDFNFYELAHQLPALVIFSLLSFGLVGSYKGIIRHTGTRDVFNVFLGTTLLTAILLFFTLFNRSLNLLDLYSVPFSIIIINYLVTTFLLIVSRFIFKALYEIISTEVASITNVLIYGAGDAGMITYSAINRDNKNDYQVVGFIDEDKNKIGKKLDRVLIYDANKVDGDFISKNNIKEVIISIQNIKPSKLLSLTDKFLDIDVEVKITPPISKWIGGDLEANQIKQLKIEDLLERKPILIDNPIIKKDVNNKTILVTGAAGSIGSEITRQLAKYSYKELIIVDQSESPLYDLQQELIHKKTKKFTAIVADVRDKNRMRQIFEKFKPQKVYHAAAYKHVPLMEDSPYESVRVNVLGTKIIGDLSIEFNVERFVMVSTDKAVNPTNIMGATKRIAEMYISCLSSKNTETKFTITRFGNVLGSNGSVIPLFKKQIENGGPLTVTHKEITRYFMTIPEACSLVLEAGTMGKGGEVYIFDMGKSIKIFDIAKRMISLSGLNYPKDIDIKITGLRPGEKLYEELLANGENTLKTYHEKIMIAKTQPLHCNKVIEDINKLCAENLNQQNYKVVEIMKDIVPEYKSNNSVYEKLDVKKRKI